ncbi:MAG: Ig-like domain-containing protein [Pirellulaceae bacterium]
MASLVRFTLIACFSACHVLAEDTTPDHLACQISHELQNGHFVIQVNGLTNAQLQNLVRADSQAIKVFVQTTPDIAMLGTWQIDGPLLVFEPQFPFRPGIEYGVLLHWDESTATHNFTIPRPNAPTTTVQAVYPSGTDLPENLLRIYVHFSAPMQQGDVYRQIQLLDEEQQPVDLPFVELAEELWDTSGTRLTLLLDPGRIKQGLKPREQEGTILQSGQTYTLEIRGTWQDAAGNALGKPHHKTFQVTRPDTSQPTPQRWTIHSPAVHSNQPLVIEFHEMLDHGLLERVITVEQNQQAISGRITISEEETKWTFTPDQDWRSGNYRIAIGTELEDAAGNSIRRPFEVDLKANQPPADVSQIPEVMYIQFQLRSQSDP